MADRNETEELHELLRQAKENRRYRDVNTGYRAHYMPTTQGLNHIFEGFETLEDLVCFKPYEGAILNHQRQRGAAYVPRLLHPCTESGEAVRVATDTLLRKKMKEALHIHDAQQDGDLDMCIKFGKVYCLPDASVVAQNVPISDFAYNKASTIKPAFSPKYTPKSLIEQQLHVNGYTCKSEREIVRITVCTQFGRSRCYGDQSPRAHIQFNIELDQNLRLRYVSPHDIRFVCLHIISGDESYADVRLIVNSSQKFFPVASGEGASGEGMSGEGMSGEGLRAEGLLRDYIRGDWVLRDDQHGLVINTDNPLHSKLTYASTRKERVYELERPRSLHSALEKRLQVRVQEATDYDQPRGGRFQKVTSRCEIFMHVTTREAIEEVVDSPDLVLSLFSLAIRMNPQ